MAELADLNEKIDIYCIDIRIPKPKSQGISFQNLGQITDNTLLDTLLLIEEKYFPLNSRHFEYVSYRKNGALISNYFEQKSGIRQGGSFDELKLKIQKEVTGLECSVMLSKEESSVSRDSFFNKVSKSFSSKIRLPANNTDTNYKVAEQAKQLTYFIGIIFTALTTYLTYEKFFRH